MQSGQRDALPRSRVNVLLLLGAAVTAGGICTAYAMQYVKDAPFPPKVSISAYGLPPHGWIMTLAATLIGLGSVPLTIVLRSGMVRPPRVVPILLVVWTVGTITLGWVHTNQPHTPAGPSTLVHQGAAIIAMVAFPIAVGFLIADRIRTRIASLADSMVMATLAVASLTCLVLLFLAAFGVNTAGIGVHRSWAFYQFAAAMIDLLLVFVIMAICFLDHRQHGLVRRTVSSFQGAERRVSTSR